MISELETPYVKFKIYPPGWVKPLQFITSIDTGAAASILNPDIIPDDHWVSYFIIFSTTSKEGVLITKMITRHPVMIEFFQGILYRTNFLSSNTARKDVIIGFDIYRKLKNRLIILKEVITFMG
ncbi:hypothetical protein CQW23_19638 [Capsicum baccatum]|uniref:Retropepsins domain-containing protein n=1 Tax=Capsicum baccatum TaxID=33114 RepID=A0A2G2W6E5_CAPBA|nr:hypothetical protein CQW23_19638 [Capsicum baccatum]